jgi:hypothetical protein
MGTILWRRRREPKRLVPGFGWRRSQRIVTMPNARNILIVDEDTDLRDTLVEQL